MAGQSKVSGSDAGRLWVVAVLGALVLLAATFLGGCAPSPEDHLREWAPLLPDRTVRVLTGASDEDLRGWYLERGEAELEWDFIYLARRIEFGTPEARAFLQPVLERVGRIVDEDFFIGYGSYLPRFLAELDHPTLDRIRDISIDWGELRQDDAIGDSTRIRIYADMLERSRSLGSVANQVVLLADIGQAHANLGEMDHARTRYLEALELSEGVDYVWMTCQILGTLAAIEANDGQMDRGREYLDRLSRRAMASRMAQQAARAEVFRGNWALTDQRPTTAYLHYQEARRICREFRGGQLEVRYISGLARFYRYLGCPNIVERLADQAEALHEGRGTKIMKPFRDNLRLYRAEALMEAGRTAKALELAGDVAAGVSPRPQPDVYARVNLIYGRLLLEGGELEEAHRLAVEGGDLARRDHMEFHERSFGLLKVAVLEAMGRRAEALEALAACRWDATTPGETPPHDHAEELVLGVRLTRALYGDGPETAGAVARALSGMQVQLAVDRPSSHTYLALHDYDELRWIVHDLIAEDARAGYAFEMAWRGLTYVKQRCLVFDPARDAATTKAVVEAFVAQRSDGLESAKSDHGEVHLVYVVREDDILCWNHRGEAVRRDRLDWNPDAMRALVAEVLTGLSHRPDSGGAGPSPALEANLEELADRLLPSEPVAQGSSVWVSADDALGRLPFATFDTDPGEDYRPLLDRANVGYLRFCRPVSLSPPESDCAALVVGDPVIAPEWRRRLPGLTPLAGAREEALLVAEEWGTDEILLGREATKANILARWESADRIYIGAHLDRDPEAPYLSLIPLAEETHTTRIVDEIMESADILPADLGGCELVILSACSSGAPYVEGTRAAPGLGDAFLDAGAANAVQTLWPVEDAVTRRFIQAFLMAEREGHDRVEALAKAQRSIRDGSPGGPHPYHWGAYGLVSTTAR